MKVDSLRLMKMDDVIALSKAGVSDSLIIGMMDATDSWFHLKTQDVLDLRNAGVSEKVIAAMMQPPPQPSGKTSDSNGVHYYAYPSLFWYDGFIHMVLSGIFFSLGISFRVSPLPAFPITVLEARWIFRHGYSIYRTRVSRWLLPSASLCPHCHR